MPIDNPMPGFQPQPSTAPSSGSTVFTPAPSPSRKLPTKNILLAGVLILLLAGLILGFGKARSFLSKAEGDCTPSSVQEANLTSSSVEVTFRTEKACLVTIAYGTSTESMLLKVPEESAALNHRVKLSPLLPSMTYYYQIVVDDKKVESVHSFLTKKTDAVGQTPTLAPSLSPTAVPTTAETFVFEDFVEQYGSANAKFDFDKNGVVNSSDWLEYQKSIK